VFNEEDGTLNRDKLGIIIFNDTEKRRILNRLTHPVIHKKIYREIFINFIRGKKFAVLELPLLFELNSSMLNYIYKIICVVAEEDIQISRLIERNNLPLSEAKKRIQAQMNLEEKAHRSHFVIENSGSQQDLERQALAILNILLDSNHHWKLRGILLASIFSVVAGVFFLLNRKFKILS
jgi:dephospho-CoA kinase